MVFTDPLTMKRSTTATTMVTTTLTAADGSVPTMAALHFRRRRLRCRRRRRRSSHSPSQTLVFCDVDKSAEDSTMTLRGVFSRNSQFDDHDDGVLLRRRRYPRSGSSSSNGDPALFSNAFCSNDIATLIRTENVASSAASDDDDENAMAILFIPKSDPAPLDWRAGAEEMMTTTTITTTTTKCKHLINERAFNALVKTLISSKRDMSDVLPR